MATVKITDLPELAETPAAGDMFAVVDVSADVTKKVAFSRVGGGGTNYIHQATALLNNGQIKTLTVPIDVVAAPGANILALPLYGVLSLDASAGAYTLGAGTFMLTQIVANDGVQLKNLLDGPDEFQNSFYESASALVAMCVPSAAAPSLASGFFTFPRELTAIVNKPLAIQLVTDCGNLTDGHADNTLRVVIVYFKVNMTTGALVAA